MSRQEDNLQKAVNAAEVATLWERAINLNGSGAHAIRELIEVIRNFEQADQHIGLITDRFERMAVEMDKLLQGNLALQQEVVKLFRRVSTLENKDKA